MLVLKLVFTRAVGVGTRASAYPSAQGDCIPLLCKSHLPQCFMCMHALAQQAGTIHRWLRVLKVW
eukprot:15310992-Alexandrium_andersonii.AAC.1